MADPSPQPAPVDYQSPATAPAQPKLARTMGLLALVVYGVGDMLGAGIYGLVGKAAGLMGNAVWLAFAGSMVAALLTGLSYANIGSRYPRAAGAAYVTHRAYGIAILSYLVGLAVAASGLTSMATGSRVIAGFLQELGLHLPTRVLAAGFLLFLAGVVFRGMRESTWMNVICTTVEIGGLAIVIAVGARYWGSVDYLEMPPPKPGAGRGALDGVLLVMQGSVLTFFSFIGFEDILNVSEEVKEPRKNVPRGLILALVIATLIYSAVAITAVSVVPYATLGASKNALQTVVQTAAPWFPLILYSAIGIFAVANTALLNYVMGSRMLYGMSRQGLLPAMLARVHATRRTPHVAILLLLGVVMVLAMLGDIRELADSTSLLLLAVFVTVNIALIVLKVRGGEPRGAFEVPIIIPALGALVCLTLLVARVFFGPAENRKAPMIAGGVLALIVALYFVVRPTNVIAQDVDEEEADDA